MLQSIAAGRRSGRWRVRGREHSCGSRRVGLIAYLLIELIVDDPVPSDALAGVGEYRIAATSQLDSHFIESGLHKRFMVQASIRYTTQAHMDNGFQMRTSFNIIRHLLYYTPASFRA